MKSYLSESAQQVPGLRGVFVTAMPDCLLFDSWTDEEAWNADELATYFGDLVRANRRGLRSLGSWSSDMSVTIESADTLLVLAELSEHFVCGCVFERDVPLGMVRLSLRRFYETIRENLPQITAEERARAVRLMDFVHRYAPDPHTVLMRVSARTGISTEALNDPASLDEAQTDAIEQAAKRILGLETISL